MRDKPKLTLNDGGSATYQGISTDGKTLTFSYTVAAGQNTPDSRATGISLPSGTFIKSSSNGQTAILSGATTDLGLQIDLTKPTITAVSSSPGTGDLNAGKTVVITLTMSEPVVVTASPSLALPSLALNDTGTATYTGPTGVSTSTLTFRYTVAPGQNTTALKVNSLSIPSGRLDPGPGR